MLSAAAVGRQLQLAKHEQAAYGSDSCFFAAWGHKACKTMAEAVLAAAAVAAAESTPSALQHLLRPTLAPIQRPNLSVTETAPFVSRRS